MIAANCSIFQGKLITALEGRKCGEGKVKITKDKAEADNHMDREEEDEDHPLVDLKGFTKVTRIPSNLLLLLLYFPNCSNCRLSNTPLDAMLSGLDSLWKQYVDIYNIDIGNSTLKILIRILFFCL